MDIRGVFAILGTHVVRPGTNGVWPEHCRKEHSAFQPARYLDSHEEPCRIDRRSRRPDQTKVKETSLVLEQQNLDCWIRLKKPGDAQVLIGILQNWIQKASTAASA